MIVLSLTFVVLFLAIFSLCILILRKYLQTSEIKAITRHLHRRIEARKHATLRRNKLVLMD